jgi:hypothetical protein
MYRIIGGDGKEYGPISAEGLRQWVIEGRVDAQTRVLPEGEAEWKTLGEIPELAPVLPRASPPPLAPPPLPATHLGPRMNPLAQAGMTLGILSLTLGVCCYGLPFNVAGLVCSISALSQINKDPQREQGKGMAIAGLVLSILSLLLSLVVFVMLVIFGSPNWMRKIHRL